MRYFLKIKQNGKQLALKRIQAKQQINTTDQLLALINNILNVDSMNFIVRVINDQHKFKIIPGWPLQHYGLKAGLQLQVELFPTAKQRAEEANKKEQGGELLLIKQSMGKIIQEQQQQKQEKSVQISDLVVKKYEQLLKLIQKNKTQAYIKEMKSNHPTLGPCENEFYKTQLKQIQNQLGAKGWAAIHCAVFASNKEIVEYLIEIGVDINTKTSDEWLPIQLAVRQEDMKMIDLLIAQPTLNVNICTAHGLVLNMAAQSLNRGIVEKLFMKDINFSARDHLGRSVYDVLGSNPDKQMLELLQRQERRQSITCIMAQKNVIYHALISSYRGEVICVKTPPLKNKDDYYLCINPYEKMLKVFSQKIHYPQYPKQLIPLTLINKFKIIQKSDRSWYMKSNLFYFNVSSNKSKYVFACHFEDTIKRWVTVFNQCREHIEHYPDSISKFQRNGSVILDRIQQQQIKRKASTKNRGELMSLFTSKFSQTSNQSPTKRKNSLQSKLTQTSSKQKQKQKQNNQGKLPKSQDSISSPNKQPQIKGNQSTTQIIANGLKFTDFKIIKTLGQGSFGTVFLAIDMRNPQKRKHYALKSFKKKKLVINKQIKYTVSQLNILKQLSHPYIVNLHFTFQTPNYVYLGLDYCPNRDLSHHLMNQVTFPEKQAMIYTAQILLALQYLHEKNIIYRDLKPQNIMLDEQGHVKLVDFGLSKQGQERDFVAKSFCGSPAYLSPQMLVKKGVGRQSDYYCMGAVLYEMIVGEPPFFSDDVVTLYNNISTSKLTFPKSISEEAKSLLIGLLQRNPQNRLGSRGTQQIKSHSFFKDLCWSALQKRQIKAPVREQIQIDGQDQLIAVQILHQDFDYSAQNYKINRFHNFDFVRESV